MLAGILPCLTHLYTRNSWRLADLVFDSSGEAITVESSALLANLCRSAGSYWGLMSRGAAHGAGQISDELGFFFSHFPPGLAAQELRRRRNSLRWKGITTGAHSHLECESKDWPVIIGNPELIADGPPVSESLEDISRTVSRIHTFLAMTLPAQCPCLPAERL
jgi:hypothetical protein